MQPTLRLGRLAGIQIGLHYTWLLIVVVITGSFFSYFAETHPHCEKWPTDGNSKRIC